MDVTGNKTGGRKKGVKNKDSDYKAYLKSFLDDNRERLVKELDELKGKTYVDAVITLMDFCIPKLSRTEFKGDIDVKTDFVSGYSDEQLKTISDIRKKNEGKG